MANSHRKPFEARGGDDALPIKGQTWLNLAEMVVDLTNIERGGEERK